MKKNNTKICLGFLHFLSSKRQCYPAEMAGQAMKIVQEEKVDIGVSAISASYKLQNQ